MLTTITAANPSIRIIYMSILRYLPHYSVSLMIFSTYVSTSERLSVCVKLQAHLSLLHHCAILFICTVQCLRTVWHQHSGLPLPLIDLPWGCQQCC